MYTSAHTTPFHNKNNKLLFINVFKIKTFIKIFEYIILRCFTMKGRKRTTLKVKRGKKGGRYTKSNGRKRYLKKTQKKGTYRRR